MKETFVLFLIVLMIALAVSGNKQKQKEEAIKKNDSINAVKYLNRENHGRK